MNTHILQDLADTGCTCCADEIYPAPACGDCGDPMFWDCGMATCSGYGWFCWCGHTGAGPVVPVSAAELAGMASWERELLGL